MVTIVTVIPIILNYIGAFSSLLPLVFFLLFKMRTKEKALRVILFYILYCILHEISIYVLYKYQLTEITTYLFALFTVVEFTFFCIFYKYVLPEENPKKFILPIWLGFMTFSLIDFFFINKMRGFDSFPAGLQSLFIILLCVYYLFLQIRGSTNLFIYSTANFWIIITFLIYLSGTFFLYIMTEAMVKTREFQFQYAIINTFFNLLKNVLLSIAMIMKSGEVTQVSTKNYDWLDLDHSN